MSNANDTAGNFPLVYDDLRKLAARWLRGQGRGHSLTATALVHEAYLRLGAAAFADRSAFFRAAAVAMQRVLVDHARHRNAVKRGGGVRAVNFEDHEPVCFIDPDVVLDALGAIDRLAEEDPVAGQVARYRLFAGLSIDEAAEKMGISRATAFREWSYARSWLAVALAPPT